MRPSLAKFAKVAARSRSSLGLQIAEDIERYSQMHPTILTLQHYIEFGKEKSAYESSKFLVKELPVRLANIMRELYLLPPQLLNTGPCQLIQGWYEQSFHELLQLRTLNLKEDKSVDKLTDGLDRIRNRHRTVVETMAEGVLELKGSMEEGGSDSERKIYHGDRHGVDSRIKYFLDRFYMNRIGITTLLGQHLGLYSKKNKIDMEGFIGEIQENCDVLGVAEDAFDNARFLCEQYYNTCPECDFISEDTTGSKGVSEGRIHVTYVPCHLYHMIFELLKNSLRAVVEFHKDADSLPRIRVLVCKGNKDISIKISDQGGGIRRSEAKRLFNYMYSTAPRPDSDHQTPLAGYGYGLPLSKLYARYFSGDLFLYSVDGYGTDAKICLKANLNEASEVLPIFNKTTTLRYTQSVQIPDWSAR